MEVGGHKAARPCGWLPREREEGGRRRKALWCFRERKREREARVGESKGGWTSGKVPWATGRRGDGAQARPADVGKAAAGGRTQETYRVDFGPMTQTNTAGAGCIGCHRGVGDAGGRVAPNAGRRRGCHLKSSCRRRRCRGSQQVWRCGGGARAGRRGLGHLFWNLEHDGNELKSTPRTMAVVAAVTTLWATAEMRPRKSGRRGPERCIRHPTPKAVGERGGGLHINRDPGHISLRSAFTNKHCSSCFASQNDSRPQKKLPPTTCTSNIVPASHEGAHVRGNGCIITTEWTRAGAPCGLLVLIHGAFGGECFSTKPPPRTGGIAKQKKKSQKVALQLTVINPVGIELSRELLKRGQPCGGLSS